MSGLRLSLPDTVKSVLGAKAFDWQKKLTMWNQRLLPTAVVSGLAQTGAAPATTRGENRTLCRPIFQEGDSPIDYMAAYTSGLTMPQSEFEANKTPLVLIEVILHCVGSDSYCFKLTRCFF